MLLLLAFVGIVSAAAAGVAVYLHQSAATQAKIDAALAAAKAAAANLASKV